MRRISQRGQTLLIVVLIMTVALVVGLGIVSRSIISLRTSTNSENSQQALSAAEAGVEKVLKNGVGITSPQQIGSAFIQTAQVVSSPATSFVFNGGAPVVQDDGADLWLVTHDTTGAPVYAQTWPADVTNGNNTSGTLTFYWCATSDTTCAALEIISLSKNGTATSSRYTYDPNAGSNGNNFTPVNCSNTFFNGVTYKCSVSISNYSGSLIRVIPLYNSTIMAVSGSFSLPDQGTTIQSTGAAGDTERKVIYFQGYPKLPSALFQYVLLVGSSS